MKGHQIGDGVAVFGTVESPDGRSAWIDVLRINLKCPELDPLRQRVSVFGRRSLVTNRRHHVGANILQDIPPEIRSCYSMFFRSEPIQFQVAFFHAVTVALVAVRLQDWNDVSRVLIFVESKCWSRPCHK